MNCKCAEQIQLKGSDATKKVEQDLKLVQFNPHTWEWVYQCRKCGTYWLGGREHGEMHGGGVPVLKKCEKNHCVDLIDEEQLL